MLLRTITLKFNAVTGQFDEEDLQEFIKDKELLSVREHFFIKHETPYLAVFITYLPGTDTLEQSGKKKDVSWRALLSEEQLPLFNTLRDWRAERAKLEGVPTYFIFKNDQLVQMVANRPKTLAELGKIRGIGKAKLEQYGQEILAILMTEETHAKDPKQKDAEQHHAEQDSQKNLFKKDTDAATEGPSTAEKDGDA